MLDRLTVLEARNLLGLIAELDDFIKIDDEGNVKIDRSREKLPEYLTQLSMEEYGEILWEVLDDLHELMKHSYRVELGFDPGLRKYQIRALDLLKDILIKTIYKEFLGYLTDSESKGIGMYLLFDFVSHATTLQMLNKLIQSPTGLKFSNSSYKETLEALRNLPDIIINNPLREFEQRLETLCIEFGPYLPKIHRCIDNKRLYIFNNSQVYMFNADDLGEDVEQVRVLSDRYPWALGFHKELWLDPKRFILERKTCRNCKKVENRFILDRQYELTRVSRLFEYFAFMAIKREVGRRILGTHNIQLTSARNDTEQELDILFLDPESKEIILLGECTVGADESMKENQLKKKREALSGFGLNIIKTTVITPTNVKRIALEMAAQYG
jgi:hypothetical protein